MDYFVISYIIVYSTTIIANALKKEDNSIKLKVVKYWLTQLEIN